MRQQTKYTKKQKFLLMLPVLVVPFLTMGFYALGGGQGNPEKEVVSKGLNRELPDAHLESKEMDKMAYYDKAASDSVQSKKDSMTDPYLYNPQLPDAQLNSTSLQGIPTNAPYGSNLNYGSDNEAKIYQKLGALNKALNQPIGDNTQDEERYNSTNGKRAIDPADIDRLEQMMHNMQSGGGTDDPESKQLNNMLEKILDIQHPERVKEKIKQSEDNRKGQVYPVTTAVKKDRISLLENTEGLSGSGLHTSTGFYGAESTMPDEIIQNAIEAVVHENQTLVNGSTVKLRLLDTINVKGTLVPKDNFVYGTVSLDGERLIIKISSLRYRKSLFPVKLSVFDIDGQDGIYIPGAIARDVAKQSAEQTVQGIGLNTFDQSLGVQAAGAGIEAAKTLFSKKIKLIKVMVKAGYKVLLRDDQQKDE